MKTRRAEATLERRLRPEAMTCPECGETLRIGYTHWRKVAMLEGLWCLKVSIGRCENPACARYHRSVHPLEEGHLVLPHDE
jgi:transposase